MSPQVHICPTCGRPGPINPTKFPCVEERIEFSVRPVNAGYPYYQVRLWRKTNGTISMPSDDMARQYAKVIRANILEYIQPPRSEEVLQFIADYQEDLAAAEVIQVTGDNMTRGLVVYFEWP